MGEFILTLVMIWITYMAIRYSGRSRSTDTDTLRNSAFRWESEGEFAFEIVGESHYQKALKSLTGDHGDTSPNKKATAVLIPETGNPHDDKAVRVDIQGMTVGYLSREDARSFRRRLGSKKLSGQITLCNAMIVGGFVMKNGVRASYGAKLDIKPFDN